MLLRSQLSQDWPRYLPIVTESLNNSPLKKLGYLKPNDISTEADTVLVQKARQVHNIEVPQLPTFEEQNKNQAIYEANKKNLQVNDFIYLSFPETAFDKSYDTSVCFIYPSTCSFCITPYSFLPLSLDSLSVVERSQITPP